MILYAHGPDIGLGFGICRLGPLVQIIIYFYFIFELVCLCIAVIIRTVCLFT